MSTTSYGCLAMPDMLFDFGPCMRLVQIRNKKMAEPRLPAPASVPRVHVHIPM